MFYWKGCSLWPYHCSGLVSQKRIPAMRVPFMRAYSSSEGSRIPLARHTYIVPVSVVWVRSCETSYFETATLARLLLPGAETSPPTIHPYAHQGEKTTIILYDYLRRPLSTLSVGFGGQKDPKTAKRVRTLNPEPCICGAAV